MTVTVEVEHTGHGTIHVVSFDRAQARNAMDTELLAATIDALDAVDRQADARGVLLTGRGGAFSAGADVHEALEDGGRRRMELFTALYEQLTLFRLPTAAAIEGPAVGGGAEVAAACDLRVAAAGATFRFPGAAFGIPIGMARTIGQVGLSTAKDWVLSTRTATCRGRSAHDVGDLWPLASHIPLTMLGRPGINDAPPDRRRGPL
ncbi:MAG: enoyl-CoA hydratase/isomerase family protein [Intrasporangiaceae bacterium]|nr:enoyl-CoA hydratase/isomerase family protein [Intrasporangiaceae bacterium]